MRFYNANVLYWSPNGLLRPPFGLEDGVIKTLAPIRSVSWDHLIGGFLTSTDLPFSENSSNLRGFGTEIVQGTLPETAAAFLPHSEGGAWKLAAATIPDQEKLNTDLTGMTWDLLDLCPSVAWASVQCVAPLSNTPQPTVSVGVQRHAGRARSTVSCKTIQTNYQTSALPGLPSRMALNINTNAHRVLCRHYGKTDVAGERSPYAEFVRSMEQIEAIQWVVSMASFQTLDGLRPGPYERMIDAIRLVDSPEALYAVAANPQWRVSPDYLPGWELLSQRFDRWDPVHAGLLRRMAYAIRNQRPILQETLDEKAHVVLGARKEDMRWRMPEGQ